MRAGLIKIRIVIKPGNPTLWQGLSVRSSLNYYTLGQIQEAIEHTKARIRAKVEHPFHVVKNLFKHKKTRYRGLAKNAAQLLTLFGLANLMLAKGRLMANDAQGAS